MSQQLVDVLATFGSLSFHPPPPAPGIALGSVSDGWLAMADRIIAKNVVLVVEKGLTQTQLQNAMSKYAISKIRGQNGNNVVIYFDSNNFGEVTAPHIRRPPLQSTVVAKMWNNPRGPWQPR